ncbi:MAG: phosphoribosylformylglycinamidine cyclo-ligase [Wenzhouxiangellaceae bacterium]
MSKLDYRAAGVDIDAGNELVQRIKPALRKTLHQHVLTGIGGFGAAVALPPGLREPVLISGTDGVGTKLLLAMQHNDHTGIGIDLVAMCVNDILVQGATPLFFLDYYACGKLDVAQAAVVIEGIARGCEIAGCALVGGETAEMPGMYAEQHYDLAGFAVGVVEREQIITGTDIRAGDVLIGLASSGPHSNGYSLIRRIIEHSGADLSASIHGSDRSLAELLLQPTTIYVPQVLRLLQRFAIHGMAHITGGGLTENIVRVLDDGLGVAIDPHSWPRPAIFHWLQQQGDLDEAEMRRTFNCGIGFVLIVAAASADDVLAALDQPAWRIGTVIETQGSERVRFLPA